MKTWEKRAFWAEESGEIWRQKNRQQPGLRWCCRGMGLICKSNENPFTALKRRSVCVMMNTNVHEH